MNIPQGMAYGLLAGLEPVNGLYVSLVLPFIYAFLTKSHHIAMGTFAVISLMVQAVITEVESEGLTGNVALNTSWWCGTAVSDASDVVDYNSRVNIAITLSLLVGLIQVILGFLHFGFMAAYLSDSLVQGLTTGAAVHVFTSQVSHVTGIKNLPTTSSPLGVLKFYICLFTKLKFISWPTVGFSAVCITAIYVVKTFVDPKTKPKIKVPIPIDLVVVAGSTLVSFAFQMRDNFNIQTVGAIPKGLPEPIVPDFTKFNTGPYTLWDMLPDALSIAIVSYALNVSLGKIFSKKMGYPIDINQEWFATGICHIVGSFFRCHPGGASLSRSMVQSTAGGKTQMVSVFSSMMILIVVVAIADIFEYLPKCALAAIIIVALKGMFMQFKELPSLWRNSMLDFLLWTVAFLSVVTLNVKFGLLVSIAFALITLIYRMQWPSYSRLGKIRGTWIFKNIDAYAESTELPHIRIFRFESPLTFVNCDAFVQSMIRCTDLDPMAEKRRRKKNKKLKITEPPTVVEVECRRTAVESVVLDCSSIAYVDIMGTHTMMDVYRDYRAIDVQVLFASCKIEVRETLERCKFFEKVPKSHLFPTLEDAVRVASSHTPLSRRSSSTESSEESESEMNWRF